MPDPVLPSASLNPTFLDFLQSLDPADNVQTVGEILNETNQMLQDMTFQEGNLLTGHRFSVRTSLPTPVWRRFYQGVPNDKSTRATITASTGYLEAYATVDKALADLNGNAASFRLQEDMAFVEGMTQTAGRYFVYGDEATEPHAITGLAPHYNTKAGALVDQIVDAGGTGTDNASIWLIGYGVDKIYGITPKGSKAGIQITDKGQQTVQALNDDGVTTGNYEAYVTHYRWDLGLVVQDYRYVVRIANIDRSLLGADPLASGYTGANLPDLMFQAMEMLPSLENCRPVWYMDRTILTMLRRQFPNFVKHSTLTMMDLGGKRVFDFQNIPIRRHDQLRVDEARVV